MALDEATNPVKGVSGPGKFSKRTDLDYQSTAYGDGVAYDANKSAAPLARARKSPLLSESPEVPIGNVPQAPIGLFDPTQNPDEPIENGIDRGPGLGSNALGMSKANIKTSDTLAKLIPFDTDGSITILYQQAVARGD
jgi:hypothetical protein